MNAGGSTGLAGTHEQAVLAVLETSEWEIEHVRHVRRLARVLFVALRQSHGLSDEAGGLLEAAALLHDLGYPTDPALHHKISARIIRSLLGAPFTPEEVEVVALLARYHRKALPALKHRRFGKLSEERRRTVVWLGGILRVADGLDRAHLSAIQCLTAVVVHHRLLIRVSDGPPSGDRRRVSVAQTRPGLLASSVEGALLKRDLLERAMGVPVLVEPMEAQSLRSG